MHKHENSIEVHILTNRESGLLLAVSDDLKGLYVHGRTEAQLFERIPQAIKALLEASGKVDVVVFQDADNDDNAAQSFAKPTRVVAFEAEYA